MKIQLRSRLAKIPVRANPWDAGADLFTIEGGILKPGERRLFSTGLAIELPDSYVGLICPRSGIANSHGISIVNAPGVIDSGYRGEIKINLINLGQNDYLIGTGDKIAQLVIHQVAFPTFEDSSKLSESIRGLNGHGSSGQ
jgi:dUTP pyrophosphatase